MPAIRAATVIRVLSAVRPVVAAAVVVTPPALMELLRLAVVEAVRRQPTVALAGSVLAALEVSRAAVAVAPLPGVIRAVLAVTAPFS